MSARLFLALFGALLVTASVPRTLALAAPPDVQLEVTPATIQLAVSETTEVLVVVRNTTERSISELALTSVADAGLTATPVRLDDSALAAGASRAWTIRVGRTADAPAPGAVHFQLDYLWQAPNGGESVTAVAVATLEVEDRPDAKLDEIAEVRVESGVELLQEPQTGFLYLVARNKSSVPITVTHIITAAPLSINLRVPDLGEGQPVAPRQTRTFPVEASATDRVRTGKQTVLFEIGLTWPRAGRVETGSLLVTQTLAVGVLGESDILQLVGVPSFFILPGFLFVTTLALLRARLIPGDGKGLGLTPKEGEFWVVAITLSLAAGWLYPVITTYALGQPRNYFEGYGLRDVYYVWLGSLAFATTVWLGSTLVVMLLRWHESELTRSEQRRTIPTPDDAPLTILDKMERAGTQERVRRVFVRVGNNDEAYFVVREQADGFWVVPPLRWKWLHREGSNHEEFVRRLDSATNPDALAALLKAEQKAGGVELVGWSQTQAYKRPTLVAKEAVSESTDVRLSDFTQEDT